MEIKILNNVDYEIKDIDQLKISLANKVIDNIYPLLDEVYQERIKYLKEIFEVTKNNKKEIKEAKKRIKSLADEHLNCSLANTFLTKTEKVLSLLQMEKDGKLKNKAISMFKRINHLTKQDVDDYSRSILELLKKRVK